MSHVLPEEMGSITALGKSKHSWKLLKLIPGNLKKKINYIFLVQKKPIYTVISECDI